jgi:CxxC motif-containing protein
MSVRELICVVCPNGCQLSVEVQDGPNPVVTSVQGQTCPRGETWARQEIEMPMRTIASSVLIHNGITRLASVRTDSAIPLEKIFQVMEEIRKTSLEAPVRIGDIVLDRPAGTDCRVIVTRNVEKAGSQEEKDHVLRKTE